jgi:hypothetical protein
MLNRINQVFPDLQSEFQDASILESGLTEMADVNLNDELKSNLDNEMKKKKDVNKFNLKSNVNKQGKDLLSHNPSQANEKESLRKGKISLIN